MNKARSRYFETAARMDEALLACLEEKELAYITVKEICGRAGVNRSTFYLHYETIADLLDECVAYTNDQCFRRYPPELADVRERLQSERPEDWVLLSPDYLRPYVEFVQQNKRLYRVVLGHRELFRTQRTFRRLFEEVFSPALDKFHVREQERDYLVRFYLGGITAVIEAWIERDCADPVEQIVELCMRCVCPGGVPLGAWQESAALGGIPPEGDDASGPRP